MSESYYCSGAVAASPGEAILAALAAGRAKATGIDEIIFLCARRAQPPPELPSGAPLSCWANQPGLDGALLQHACRLLASGERRQVLIVQQARARSAAVLLVGPAAIGIYNLVPAAQVHPGWTLPASLQPGAAAAAALDTAGVERAGIHWLAAGLTKEEMQACFPSARLTPRTPTGVIFKLNATARALKAKSPLACIIDAPEGQAVRVILVEKI